jgi:hypothetical protein
MAFQPKCLQISHQLSPNFPQILIYLSLNVQLVDGFQLLDFSSLNVNQQVIQAIREQLDKIDSEVLLIIKQ